MTSAIIAGTPASTLVSEQKSTRKKYTKSALVCGVGMNDFHDRVLIDGRAIRSYDTWHSMLRRCYAKSDLSRRPTYTVCSVADSWLSFSTFEKWYTENYVEGYQLDKDILIQGNKVYSPDTCVFVPQALNGLLEDSRGSRGVHPIGVARCGTGFQATIRLNSRNVYLGRGATPQLAHKLWQLKKAEIIENFPTTDPRIRKALDLRVAQLRDDHANNRITTKL